MDSSQVSPAMPAGLAPGPRGHHPPDWQTRAVSPPGPHGWWCCSQSGTQQITNRVTWESTMCHDLLPRKMSLWSHSWGRWSSPTSTIIFRESAACGYPRSCLPKTVVRVKAWYPRDHPPTWVNNGNRNQLWLTVRNYICIYIYIYTYTYIDM